MAKKKSFLLRLPPELIDELQRWSNDELRSLNGQIEYVLRDVLRKQRGYTGKHKKGSNEEP